ncbi:hypothetical protein LBW62_25095 [Ralstonia solanacearum]|uniref:hypothetical protein n=1 Tax=Ralstonia solanacearum TaxID=305 RepID=UPI000A93D81D|nr:hypothetical protein [Ralstonia solanacearum]MDB0544521.1 hypothetical protein [Ralstonia solanacearum]MDB0554325.1 hypothetical protein [Ralstonia solanacearum]MDB0559441.1 hypothetical protein [Ralstonia solanacearum]
MDNTTKQPPNQFPEKKARLNQYKLVITGATFPLIVAWVQSSFFQEINRGLIFILLTAPFFIALSIANAIQEKNDAIIKELLGEKFQNDAISVMTILSKHSNNSAPEIASKYWRIHRLQMYLAGHGFGWLILVFVYFFRWFK